MLTETNASDSTRNRHAAPAGRWSVDAARSHVTFTVRHMLVASVQGRFTEFGGTLEVTPDGAATARGTVNAGSIDTDEPVRDERMRRSAEFFDVERFPEISYASRHVTLSDNRIVILGDLTLRGITRELELRGQASDPFRDANGKARITLGLRGELDRSRFGITWNETIDKGGVLLGDKVKFKLDISATHI
jgi:polyisoprenoid-binding protein YceI